jgi:hypothetical protein
VLEIGQGNIGTHLGDGGMIDGDHLSICKFGANEAEKDRFKVIAEGIKEMVKESPRQKGTFHQLLLRSSTRLD